MDEKVLFQRSNKKYPIPKNLIISDEVKNVIKILSEGNNSKLVNIILKEKENENINEDIKNRTIIEISIKAFLNGKIPDNNIVPFPEVAPEYLVRICKTFFNKDDCNLFLNMLIKNKIIESKNIYKDLVNRL